MKWFYLIDKPSGMTSYDVIRQLKKCFQTRRIWHTGTLDPSATGLLLVAVWEYTKLIPFIENKTKTYEFDIMLDGVSPSYDSDTPIEYISDAQKQHFTTSLLQEDINTILQEKFTGDVDQIPPKYSAVKVGGKKALNKLLDGEEFELKSRTVHISHIEIIDFAYPKLIARASVSNGTYIRTIAYDLWAILGTGGYISSLRRTIIGELWCQNAQQLDDFDTTMRVDDRELFSASSMIRLSDTDLADINNGKKVLITDYINHIPSDTELYVYDESYITNIVRREGDFLFAVRKI